MLVVNLRINEFICCKNRIFILLPIWILDNSNKILFNNNVTRTVVITFTASLFPRVSQALDPSRLTRRTSSFVPFIFMIKNMKFDLNFI